MDLTVKEAQMTAAHHAAEEAFWDTVDTFFHGTGRVSISGDLAVRWNDMITEVITEVVRKRDEQR